MDIAEIRKKARLLQDRGEKSAAGNEEPTFIREAEIPSEIVQQGEIPEKSEVEAVPREPLIEVQREDRQPEPSAEVGGMDSVEEQKVEAGGQKNQESETWDLQKQELFINEEVGYSVKEETPEGEVEAIIFSLDNEDYAVDIHQVKEVIKVRELTVVPKAPRDIMGVISLRGVVIPVMNLRERLGMPMKNSGERIIIVADGTGLLGLLVDTVRNVVRVAEKSIEPPPSINTIDGELIRGVGRHKGGMFILIDMKKMLEIR